MCVVMCVCVCVCMHMYIRSISGGFRILKRRVLIYCVAVRAWRGESTGGASHTKQGNKMSDVFHEL